MDEGQGGLDGGGIYSASAQQPVTHISAMGSAGEAGDILISNGKQKKSWKKWVFFACTFLVLVIVVAVLLVINMSDGERAARSAFLDLNSFIQNGNSIDESNGGELPYALSVADESAVSIQKYYEELDLKVQIFVERSRGIISENILSDYVKNLRIMENAVDFFNKGNLLIKMYDDGGYEEALRYYDENIVCEVDGDGVGRICAQEVALYKRLLDIHIELVKTGCYDGAYYDMDCLTQFWGGYDKVSAMGLDNGVEYFSKALNNDYSRAVFSLMLSRFNDEIMVELDNA